MKVHPAGGQVERADREGAAIVITKAAVDAEQDHRLKLDVGDFQHALDFFRLEHARALLGAIDAHALPARLLEALAEAHRRRDVAFIEGVLEELLYAPNLVAEPDQAKRLA